MNSVLWQSDFPGLSLLSRGKVRDLYEVNGDLLLVATDRLSAFDVILPTPIPDKGKVLTQLSRFWFETLQDVVPNHVITTTDFPPQLDPYRDALAGRAMLCRKTQPILVECVVRGYLSGSGWKEYRASGAVCGIPLPPGLGESARLPEAIFTPSTKAASGHDENISFDQMSAAIGGPLAEQLRSISIDLYRRAADFAEPRGIILADTKFEFGLIGNALLVTLYVLLIARGLMIAANAATFFARLLAASITLMFFTYAFVNMGMVAGILPVVGVPLPFISYGGTALLTLFIGIGILMSVHSHRRLVQT